MNRVSQLSQRSIGGGRRSLRRLGLAGCLAALGCTTPSIKTAAPQTNDNRVGRPSRRRPHSLRLCTAVAAGAAIVASARSAAAQDDVQRALDSLERRLASQERQISAQSAVIEDQQWLLERQTRELTELRIRTDAPGPMRSGPGVQISRELTAGDIEPAELFVTPLSLPASATTIPAAATSAVALPNSASASSAPLRETSSNYGAAPTIHYDHGLLIASPRDNESSDESFPLKVNGRFQFRHTAFDSDGPNRDENQVELERVRLVFSGHAFTTDLSYFAQLDGDSDGQAQVDMLDYYLLYDIGHAELGWDSGRLAVKGGKYRMPFARARQDSGFMLQFVDRATGSDFFDINRSLGVSLIGRTPLGDQTIGWETAVFNGFRDDTFAPNRAGELDRNFGFATRVTTDFISPWGQDGEPDLSWHERPSVKLGAATAFTRVRRDDGLLEFSSVPALADSGLNPFVVDVLPAAVDEFSIVLAAVDANFKYRGFTVLSEYYVRELTEFSGAAVDDRFDHGFTLQAGYFLCREKLELVGRWSRVVGNSGSLGDTDHSSDDLAAGISWYLRGHDLKFVFDVSHFNGVPVTSPTLNVQAGDDGWLFRTQLQLLF